MIPESDIPAIRKQARKDQIEEFDMKLAVKEILAEFKPKTYRDLDKILEIYLERCSIGIDAISNEFLRYARAIAYLKLALSEGYDLTLSEI